MEAPLNETSWSTDGLIGVLKQVARSSPFYERATRMLDRRLVVGAAPVPPPAMEPRRLTIGMCTYDDFDGVYFSLQAIRLYHPEVLEHVNFLVIDNHPTGVHAEPVARLCAQLPECHYFPYRSMVGTATRDLLFRISTSDFVLCMDSHVMFPPGVLARLLAYIDEHPDTNDLLQGPLVNDSGTSVSSHFEPTWSDAMWGRWSTDERARDPEGPPFEVPMQGLGVFACRREAWPGLNRKLGGFGGEEGYVHERVRRAGGRTLCLPFFRWLHRFGRPAGVPYPNVLRERLRNYLLIAHELGDDPGPAVEHFRTRMPPEDVDEVVEAVRVERSGPFAFFDAIYCINLDRQADRWQALQEQLARVGLCFSGSVRRVPAVETPDNHHVGCALSHRAILEEARWQGLRNVLVLEDDVRFSPTAVADLAASLHELQDRAWDLLYLGGHRWGQTYPLLPGCRHLEIPRGLTCTHAIAYNHTVYNRLLEELPARPSEMALWLETYKGIDQFYAYRFQAEVLLVRPAVATQPGMAPHETGEFTLQRIRLPEGTARL